MIDSLNITNFLTATLILAILLLWLRSNRKYKIPPGPPGVPILGYLPFMDDDPLVVFKRLSEKYGKIFSLYLGRSLTVVLNDYDSVREAFIQNTLIDRPTELFEFSPGGRGFLASNGKEWVDQRRYTIKALKDIGLGKTRWEEELVQDELNDLMKHIEAFGGKPVDVTKAVYASVSNNVTSLVFGKRLVLGDPRRDLVDEEIHVTAEIFDQAGVVSMFPLLLKFIARLGFTKLSQQRSVMRKFNQFIWSEVEYHKNLPPSSNEETFISGYLKEIEESKKRNERNYFTEKNLVGHTQALIVAGSDTVAISLLWLLLAITSYQDVQNKVHEEIYNVLGRNGRTNWMDRLKFPYTVATIMEGQRWRTVAPLSLIHKASEDSKVNGFDIPKGTRIICNSWAVHNDPKYWSNPERFIPERYMDENGHLKVKKIDGYVPFSIGRRSCPGEVVGLIELFHYFISLIQNFQILPPSDGEEVNLNGINGGTYQPIPQKLRFIPK